MAEEKIKLNDLLTRLGVDEKVIAKVGEDGIDKEVFNKHFDDTWISISKAKTDDDFLNPIINDRLGKRMGGAETSLKSSAKKSGFELPSDVFKDDDGNKRKLEEVISVAMTHIGTQFADLKESANKGNSDKLDDANTKLEAANTEIGRIKDLNTQLEENITEKDTSHQAEMTDFIITNRRQNLISNIPLIDGVTSIQKRGLEAMLNDLTYSLDDNKELVVADADGKPIRDDKDINELKPEDVFNKIANSAGLLKQNNSRVANPDNTLIFDKEKNSEADKAQAVPASVIEKNERLRK